MLERSMNGATGASDMSGKAARVSGRTSRAAIEIQRGSKSPGVHAKEKSDGANT
jgi:hypothetical protein